MEYVLHVLVMVCIYGILATSFNLLVGFAGLFAMAQAAFYAFGAYATAILTLKLGLPFPIDLLIGVAVTGFIGALVAIPAIRISGTYLVVVTLALQVIVIAVATNWKSLTGGTDGIRGVPSLHVFGYALNNPGRFLPAAILALGVCFWIAWRLTNSPFGRALRAMRENESAAEAIGKDLLYMKVAVFAFSAGLAAVAGSLFARYLNYVGAESFGIEETIYMLAMVILGGTGNLWGSLIGAAVLVVLPELLKFVTLPTEIADKSHLIIYGVLLIAILRLRPQGLLGERSTMRHLPHVDGASSHGVSMPKPLPKGEVTLRGRDLHRRFGGIVAVAGFDIVLKSGSITGLIGPNGAGKTTAFNLLTGFLSLDAGSITFRGRDITGLKPHDIVRAGVARSFQDQRLFTKMTALENVMVALPGQTGDRVLDVFFRPMKIHREEHENLIRARNVLDFVGLTHKANETAENLSYAEEKLLVVARLLATGAEVFLFDEPLSGLDRSTLAEIFPIVRKLADNGKTICIIEHNLDVIKELCDVVYFLDEGHAMAIGTPGQLMNDPALASRYFK
jgi:ABC-type branched-subunit amino acid transport system permease subunit/ABC-type branched-subunit amino acid transport system ATPase component